MKYQKVRGTANIWRAYRVVNERPEGVAIFGTVAELAAHNLIYLDGRKPNSMWLVLSPKRAESSPELYDVQSCKTWIESTYGISSYELMDYINDKED